MRKLNIDRISIMPDDELNSHLSKIKNLLSYRNKTENKKDLEIELCYLQREAKIRESRRRAHDAFLQKRSQKRYRE